ncbi:AbrB/MazE/SpoVT family DNA-binding domain-containing protein [Agrobacterium vitis]|uniref:AbrB/MazE/SpoVT family DNA-binding domain-containing protein n=1 Tax=Agrobacterium vitis TaxID=373 RepID=UPI0012E79541|nr:antitoxin [Agrobacterium vitis]MVA63039.1 antitoxin [Agrobacterium vitis]
MESTSKHSANLFKVGGSIMVAVPPALLDVLNLSAGARVAMAVENGCLVIKPQARPRYTLEELLAQCDGSADVSAEDREWLRSEPVGEELM